MNHAALADAPTVIAPEVTINVRAAPAVGKDKVKAAVAPNGEASYKAATVMAAMKSRYPNAACATVHRRMPAGKKGGTRDAVANSDAIINHVPTIVVAIAIARTATITGVTIVVVKPVAATNAAVRLLAQPNRPAMVNAPAITDRSRQASASSRTR